MDGPPPGKQQMRESEPIRSATGTYGSREHVPGLCRVRAFGWPVIRRSPVREESPAREEPGCEPVAAMLKGRRGMLVVFLATTLPVLRTQEVMGFRAV